MILIAEIVLLDKCDPQMCHESLALLKFEIIQIVIVIENNQQQKGIAKDTELFLKLNEQLSTFQSVRKTQSHDIHR